MKFKNKLGDICIAFTFITLTSSVMNMMMGIDDTTHFHLVIRFVVTLIGIGSLYLFEWLDEWPIRVTTLLHYVISLGLVFLFAWFTDLYIEPIHENGYRDIFINYTGIYIILSIVYDIKLRIEIKNQNKLLKSINKAKKIT